MILNITPKIYIKYIIYIINKLRNVYQKQIHQNQIHHLHQLQYKLHHGLKHDHIHQFNLLNLNQLNHQLQQLQMFNIQ